MIELTRFIMNFIGIVGPDFIQRIFDAYGDNPKLFMETADFVPRLTEIEYRSIISKMNEFERKEAETLFEAVWSKGVRTEVLIDYYDWDEDEYKEAELDLPRDKRTELPLKKVCADVIYNRGVLMAHFYTRRGMFEIAGVKVFNGTGEWVNLSEDELRESVDFNDNEKAITLPHGENTCSRLVFPS